MRTLLYLEIYAQRVFTVDIAIFPSRSPIARETHPGLSMVRWGGQLASTVATYRSLKLKPFDQCELHGTVAIRPELKISNQHVTQK